MTIKTINIGTNPGDETGDGLRDGLEKINDNFTDSDNAASKLMATDQQALDGAAGVLPDAEQVLAMMGQFGVGSLAPEVSESQFCGKVGGFFRVPDFSSEGPAGTGIYGKYGVSIPRHVNSSGYGAAVWFPYASQIADIVVRTYSNGQPSTDYTLLTDKNTTVDGNGFIKSASPIINLFDDQLTGNASDGVTLAKTGTGVYVLNDVEPLAEEGWYIEAPKDLNNNIYFTLDYEQDLTARTLTIRTYTPDYSTGPATNGAPVDILPGRFVALRFNEPPAPELPEPGETGEE